MLKHFASMFQSSIAFTLLLYLRKGIVVNNVHGQWRDLTSFRPIIEVKQAWSELLPRWGMKFAIYGKPYVPKIQAGGIPMAPENGCALCCQKWFVRIRVLNVK